MADLKHAMGKTDEKIARMEDECAEMKRMIEECEAAMAETLQKSLIWCRVLSMHQLIPIFSQKCLRSRATGLRPLGWGLIR